MKIICKATVALVTTKTKHYYYKRKGYYLKGKWVKPKRILRHKEASVKPWLHVDAKLEVDQELIIGGIYMDENNVLYRCIVCSKLGSAVSELRNIITKHSNSFKSPEYLTLTTTLYSEDVQRIDYLDIT